MTAVRTRALAAIRTGRIVASGFVGFVRRPILDPGRGPDGVSRGALAGWLYLCSLAVTALAALVTVPLMLLFGAAPGSGLSRVLQQPAPLVLLALVVLGPLVEELLFRGWLTGRRRALVATAAALLVLLGGGALARALLPQLPAVWLAALLVSASLAAVVAIDRPAAGAAAPGWYARAFRYVFWGQGLVFGALHFGNIATAAPLLSIAVLPPLVICGWLWGYARLFLGIPGAWALHAAYNLPAATLAVLATR